MRVKELVEMLLKEDQEAKVQLMEPYVYGELHLGIFIEIGTIYGEDVVIVRPYCPGVQRYDVSDPRYGT